VGRVIASTFLEYRTATITGLEKGKASIIEKYQDKLIEAEKGDLVFEYKFEERPRIIVSTVAQIAEGVDLFRGNHTIWFEPGSNTKREAQAGKRQHRIGQCRPVHMYACIVPGLQLEEAIRSEEKRKKMFLQAAREAGINDEDEEYDEDDEM
jgi:hypothetical protein